MTLVELTPAGTPVFAEAPAALPRTVPVDADLDALYDEIKDAPALAIAFASFADGRAYSVARRLRDQYGYRGKLWAVGDVLVDQIHLMARVGFDVLVMRGEVDRERVTRSLARYAAVYQTAADGAEPVWLRRRRKKAA